MGFRKAIYDVEEKGLDPTVPHNQIGDDGRLLSDVEPSEPAAASSPKKESPKEKSTQKPSKGVAAKSRKRKEVETPDSKVSVEIEFKDEPLQAAEELSDNEPKIETKKRNKKTSAKTKSRTRAKKKTSSPTKKKISKERAGGKKES